MCHERGSVWQWTPLELAPHGVQGVVLGLVWPSLWNAIGGRVVPARQWLTIWELHLAGGDCLISEVRMLRASTIMS